MDDPPEPVPDVSLRALCSRLAQTIVDAQEKIDLANDESIRAWAQTHGTLGPKPSDPAVQATWERLTESLPPPTPGLSSMRVDVELELHHASEQKSELGLRWQGRPHCAYRALYFGERQGQGHQLRLTLQSVPQTSPMKAQP